ncbi:MAG: alpha/beta hydrolase [Erysipelotrichaceae bacterium]|nr:alpha/beta hydrolase [Erysipelotrichaceae bacterium]
MSTIELNGISLYYEKKGKQGKDVILLHGWGQNTEMMAFIADFLKDHFVVYNIDLPGFGKSGEPPEAWDSNDYTAFLHEFCLKKKIVDPIFIAHSFGCRIALRYAHRYGAYKMVLTGAAGVRDKHGLEWHIKTYSYKLGKKVLSLKPFAKYADTIKKNAGSEDYRNASGVMRGTLVKVVNEDITPILSEIRTETLLVFGEKDEATPVEKGKLMEKLMPDAALVIFENDDHYAYIHQAGRFNLVLDAFLRSDYDK